MPTRYTRPATGDVITAPGVLTDRYDDDPRWQRVAPADPRPLAKRTKAELIAYAEAHHIDIDPAARKTNILTAIEAATTDHG